MRQKLIMRQSRVFASLGFAFLMGNKMETIDPVTKNQVDTSGSGGLNSAAELGVRTLDLPTGALYTNGVLQSFGLAFESPVI